MVSGPRATILGAAKLVGRFPMGMTVGVLNATTERVSSPGDTTFEPRTNFALARVKQDFNNGGSGVGAIVTAVNRSVDQWSSPYLNSSAYAAAVDFRHRFLHNNYEVSGSLDHRHLQGRAAGILNGQAHAVAYYQRPHAGL